MNVLTKTERERCVLEYQSGISAMKLSGKYGISHQAIYNLLKVRGIERRSRSLAKTKYSCNHRAFSDNPDADKCYWAGFLLADGCIYEPKPKGSLQLVVGLDTNDKPHLEKLKSFLKSDYPIFDQVVRREYKQSNLRIVSNKICSDLEFYGLKSRKTLNHSIPDLDQENFRHFVRGYFDGDGCLSRSKRGQWFFQFAGSKDFLEVVKTYLKKQVPELGNASVRQHTRNCEMYSWIVGGNKQVQAVMSFLYKNADYYLERKYNLFLEMRNEIEL